jgi:hypothetical protein
MFFSSVSQMEQRNGRVEYCWFSPTGLRNGRRIARTGVHLAGTAGEQFSREGHADAAVGTGYDGDCIVYVH